MKTKILKAKRASGKSGNTGSSKNKGKKKNDRN